MLRIVEARADKAIFDALDDDIVVDASSAGQACVVFDDETVLGLDGVSAGGSKAHAVDGSVDDGHGAALLFGSGAAVDAGAVGQEAEESAALVLCGGDGSA